MEYNVSLAMIVKNEQANLKDCLDSVCDQVDEIVIVDTGSTDETLEIARKYTDKIYSYPWRGDFSAARNFAIARCNCTWILSLDADEVLLPETGNLKRVIAGDIKKEAYLLPFNNPTADSTGEYNRFHVLRLFKNTKTYRFRGKIHEQVTVDDSRVVGVAEGPVISHKIICPRERNRKRGRNLALLKNAYTEDSQNYFIQYYLGVEWLMLGKPAQALPYLRQAYQNLTDDYLLFRSPALRYLIISLQSLGKFDEANSICLEAMQRYPEYTDNYYLCGVLWGVLWAEKKEYRTAIKWFDQAVDCGTPPALYSHMNGASSFLAYYHLGYCYDMLNERRRAKYYYELALETNPDYIYPIYSLFLNLYAKHGPGYTLEYLNKRDYLERLKMCLAVAGLFFTIGYPHLALCCLENIPVNLRGDEEYLFNLGKYNIYAGRLEQGDKFLSQISKRSTYFIEAQIHRAVALLLLGSFSGVRSLAIKLWKNPAARCHSVVLLSLTRLMEKGEEINCPSKVRETDLFKIARDILEHCDRYLPGGRREQGETRYSGLVAGLETIIKQSSPRGYLVLADYYQKKVYGVQDFINCKFEHGGNRK